MWPLWIYQRRLTEVLFKYLHFLVHRDDLYLSLVFYRSLLFRNISRNCNWNFQIVNSILVSIKLGFNHVKSLFWFPLLSWRRTGMLSWNYRWKIFSYFCMCCVCRRFYSVQCVSMMVHGNTTFAFFLSPLLV